MLRSAWWPPGNAGHQWFPLPAHQVEQVVGDISDADALKKLVTDADFIVNCADDVRGIFKASFIKTNVEGLRGEIKKVELSWVLENNHRLRRILSGLGAEVYKRYQIFSKDLV